MREQLDAALENAKRAKAIRESAATEGLLGDIFEKRGDSLEAVPSYQAAVELDPSREQNRLTLGLELLLHRTFEPALVVFQQASQLFPRSERVQVALGLTYYLLTAFCVEEGERLPGLSGLPHLTYWFLPAVVGTPLIIRALVRHRLRYPRAVVKS